MDHTSIPHGIACAGRMILVVAFYLVAVADRPHPPHISLRIDAKQQQEEDER